MTALFQFFLCLFSFGILVFFVLFLRQIVYLPGYKKVDPFPIFVASLLIIMLSTFWAIPVEKKNTWTPPTRKADQCAGLTAHEINFITHHNNSLYVAYKENPAATHSKIISYGQDLAEPEHEYDYNAFVRCLAVDNHIYAVHSLDDEIADVSANTNFANLSFTPESIAISSTLLYASGENVPYITELSIHDTPTESKFETFGPGPLNTFKDPKGIFFKDGLLYVCDRNSVLVFNNRHLIRSFGPIVNPLFVTVWKKQLVVSTLSFIFFYDLESTTYLGVLKQVTAHSIAASQSTLYIVDGQSSLCVYD